MVNETSERLHDGAAYSRKGEDETDAQLLRVRELLSSLPKDSCPAGFEYRLTRRLQGGSDQSPVAAKGWMSGWLGVGLGFGVAAVIALFMLDFKGVQSNAVGSAPTAEQVVPASTDLNAGTSTVAPVEQEKLLAGTADSVERNENPTYVSPDRLQQVSGGGNASTSK